MTFCSSDFACPMGHVCDFDQVSGRRTCRPAYDNGSLCVVDDSSWSRLVRTELGLPACGASMQGQACPNYSCSSPDHPTAITSVRVMTSGGECPVDLPQILAREGVCRPHCL